MKQYTESELASILNLHKAWIIGEDYGKRADLREADLREADLREADLREANLSGADLDYSCLPLWCGSLSAQFDDKQLKQIAYHLVKAGLQSKRVGRNASQTAEADTVCERLSQSQKMRIY